MTWAFLAVALVSGAVGLAVGLPAWRSWQARAARARNAERYLTWRGRGDRPETADMQPTSAERRRIAVGAALGAVAIACLVIGLAAG
jgi:hypothetical protein